MSVRWVLISLLMGIAAKAAELQMGADADESLIKPIGTSQPNSDVFTPVPQGVEHMIKPAHNDVEVKQTNKFWLNWGSDHRKSEGWPVYVMPYALQFAPTDWEARLKSEGDTYAPDPVTRSDQLAISHGQDWTLMSCVDQDHCGNDESRTYAYWTGFVRDFGVSANETLEQHHKIIHEGLMGLHVQVKRDTTVPADAGSITYPVYSGMAYITAHYEGAITPAVLGDLKSVDKVSPGIWRFVNSRDVEYRVYALTEAGEFVDDTYDFDDATGLMNKNLVGFLRLAHKVGQNDETILDAHAQSIVTEIDLDIRTQGSMTYTFQTKGKDDVDPLHLAYAHQLMVLPNKQEAGIAPMKAPTKGSMTGLLGKSWEVQVDLTDADALGFLPPEEVPGSTLETLMQETKAGIDIFRKNLTYEAFPISPQISYYFVGKRLQKLSTLCMMLRKLGDRMQEDVKEELAECTTMLATAFKCMYDAKFAAEDDTCQSRPAVMYYEENWHGIVTSLGFEKECWFEDFGNACYNDHHYHFGYFVVAAAALIDLSPGHAVVEPFTDWIHTLLRDTANPSVDDTFFPRFRAFDFFEFHSWSRGIIPSWEGKDQESTSEEINLLYGMVLWGRATKNKDIENLGAIMLSLEVVSVKQYFLMKNGNMNHPESFVKNHATGIFFQNKLEYTTWFEKDAAAIHGIQMLPLTPALKLIRDEEFCVQEWNDNLKDLTLKPELKKWDSVMLSGNLAVHTPNEAFEKLKAKEDGSTEDFFSLDIDDGLSKAWALYWTATYMAADEPEPEDAPGVSWGFVAAMVALAVGLVALGCYFYSTGAPERAGGLNAPISNSPEGIAMTS